MNSKQLFTALLACAALIVGLVVPSDAQSVTSSTQAESRRSMALEKLLHMADHIPPERRVLLDSGAAKIRAAREQGDVNLLAVCTHNSRRSQLCQAWGSAAAMHYGVRGVTFHSCGTAATACNLRTLAALERAGWRIEPPSSKQASAAEESNPKYQASFGDKQTSITLWSKAFGDDSLPKHQIVALMCCDEADAACPTVPGARDRLALHYVDPKVSDGKPNEAATYDQRSQQIASEMFYLMSRLEK